MHILTSLSYGSLSVLQCLSESNSTIQPTWIPSKVKTEGFMEKPWQIQAKYMFIAQNQSDQIKPQVSEISELSQPHLMKSLLSVF